MTGRFVLTQLTFILSAGKLNCIWKSLSCFYIASTKNEFWTGVTRVQTCHKCTSDKTSVEMIIMTSLTKPTQATCEGFKMNIPREIVNCLFFFLFCALPILNKSSIWFCGQKSSLRCLERDFWKKLYVHWECSEESDYRSLKSVNLNGLHVLSNNSCDYATADPDLSLSFWSR